MTVDKEARKNRIFKFIDRFPCIAGWKVGKLLGIGTVGTVWAICNDREGKCAAIKIQEMTTKKEKLSFLNEVENQKAFAPYAPRVYTSCTIESNTYIYAAVVMEIMGDELDKCLTHKRMSKAKLNQIGKQVLNICEFLQASRITHGDLALFNLAFDKEGELKMIDFDRSSKKFFCPEVDFFRLQLELYKSFQSNGTKNIPTKNLSFLRKEWLHRWAQALGGQQPARTGGEADANWEHHYEKYCKKARILCLN